MMVLFKKLFLILSVATIAMQSDAMLRLSRVLVLATVKRSTVLRSRAIKPAVQPQVFCKKAVMAYKKPQKSVLVCGPNKLLSSFPNARYKANNGRAWLGASSIKRLAGTGMALSAVFATAQAAACEDDKAQDANSTVQYQAPFEESRKKFYASLQAKPWGEVSKKYIKALQEEEQKLWDEICTITKVSRQEFEKEAERMVQDCISQENTINIACKNEFGDIPLSLFAMFKEAANTCFVNPVDMNMQISDKFGFTMLALRKTIYAHPMIIRNGLFRKWEEKEIKALLMHEMMHILHNDTRYFTLFGNLRSPNISQDFVNRYILFMERRADILAGLANSIRLVDLKDLIVNRFHEDQNHPSPSDRAAYLTQLHKEMTDAIAKK